MSISSWITRNAIRRLRCKDIGDGRGNIFFNRYTVLKTPFFGVYLHQFFRGDSDRCLHDHPWPFVSVILAGGYYETLFTYRSPTKGELGANGWMKDGQHRYHTTEHWRKPGSILWRPADTSHRIDMKPGTQPWSLVFVGRKSRDWGFWTPQGWWKWRPGGSPICETE